VQTSLAESDPAAARAFDLTALEAQKAEAARVAREAAYRNLQASLMAELGVEEGDITPLAAGGGAADGAGGGKADEGGSAAWREGGVGAGGGLPSDATTPAPVARNADVVPPTGAGAATMLTKRAISGSGAAAAKTLVSGSSAGAGTSGTSASAGAPKVGFKASTVGGSALVGVSGGGKSGAGGRR